MAYATWTSPELALLRRCWADGETGAEIAAKLPGRSVLAIYEMARRLQLGRRGKGPRSKVAA